MTLADCSLVKGFLSAAKTDWPITTATIKRICFTCRHPTPPATPAQGLMPSSETCIKIAKALREFDGEEGGGGYFVGVL